MEARIPAFTLLAEGFTLEELSEQCSAADVIAANVPLKALKEVGYSPKALREARLSCAQLRALGFTPSELKEGGFSAKDLHGCGVGLRECRDIGYSTTDVAAAAAGKKKGDNGSEALVRDAG